MTANTEQLWIDCPRCRKQVSPVPTLGNLYCPNCSRWLMSVADYELEVKEAQDL